MSHVDRLIADRGTCNDSADRRPSVRGRPTILAVPLHFLVTPRPDFEFHSILLLINFNGSGLALGRQGP
jgi:hypothetical protein